MEPRKCLATIKLNSYTGGYYDPITRIHLTIGNPTANLYAGMNLTGIRKAIRLGTLSVISGHIDGLAPEFKLERRGNKFVLVPNKKASVTVSNVEPVKLNVKSSRVKKIQQAQEVTQKAETEQKLETTPKAETIATAPDLPASEPVKVMETPVEPVADLTESVTAGVSDIETLGSLVDFPVTGDVVEESAEDGEQTRQKKKKHKH